MAIICPAFGGNEIWSCEYMKKGLVWKILLLVGICPLIAPFGAYIYQMMISADRTLVDWLVMYSFVYWPTYIIGFVLIAISVNKLIK